MPFGYTDWPVSPQCPQICVSPALGLQMVTLPLTFYVALRSSCSPIKHFTDLISPAFPTPLFKATAWTRNYHLPFSGALGPVPLCLFQSTQHEGQEPGSTSQEVLTWTLKLLVLASYWHFQISMQGMSVLSAWFLNTKLQWEERNANVLAICRTLLHVGRSTTPRFPRKVPEEGRGSWRVHFSSLFSAGKRFWKFPLAVQMWLGPSGLICVTFLEYSETFLKYLTLGYASTVESITEYARAPFTLGC